MDLRSSFVLIVLMWVRGGATEDPGDQDTAAHPEFGDETQNEGFSGVESVMATGELNPNHYPARRAAKVVQHFLNTRYGSPYRLFGLDGVGSATAEDLVDGGRRYQLEISVHEIINDTKQKCSAEVSFPRGERVRPAQVQTSCEEILRNNTAPQEEVFFQKYKSSASLLSAQNIPDNFGHMEPDMMPFWHLGIVAASFVMLNESTEDTLYNMAQVANITQLETDDNHLKFDILVLLHDMVSQEILHWKLLFTWSPAEGVKVEHMQQLPKPHQ